MFNIYEKTLEIIDSDLSTDSVTSFIASAETYSEAAKLIHEFQKNEPAESVVKMVYEIYEEKEDGEEICVNSVSIR